TTPWIACAPKWPLAGAPNTRVTLENGTSDPPLTQTCSVDSTVSPFENGAGAPLPVIVARPVTMKPWLVMAGPGGEVGRAQARCVADRGILHGDVVSMS